MARNIVALDLFAPVGSLESYIQRANQIPMLSVDEETALALRLYHENDLSTARQLILPHLRFVIRVARQYVGYGIALADLIQEGNIGLMKAVRRFDPSRGVRLVSFAVHWIKAEIHEFIIRNWRIVKVATTKAQRKLFFHLRSSKKRLGWFSQDEVEALASDLGVSTADVVEMENRMNVAHDMALEHFGDAHEAEALPSSPLYTLPDLRYAPEKQMENHEAELETQKISQALLQLDARSRTIIEKRFLADKKATLHTLAEEYQVSPERIRQIEEKALDRMKTWIASQRA